MPQGSLHFTQEIKGGKCMSLKTGVLSYSSVGQGNPELYSDAWHQAQQHFVNCHFKSTYLHCRNHMLLLLL